MHFVEYDSDGSVVEQRWDETDPEVYYDTEKAKVELVTRWNASETGAKEKPDNAHGPFLLFWARVPEEQRRICPVIEVGFPWRKGVGVRIGGVIYGLWVPTVRPRKPKLDTPERMDISPAELLGEVA